MSMWDLICRPDLDLWQEFNHEQVYGY